MRTYELIFIVPNKYTEEEEKKIIKGIEQILKDQKCEIIETNNYGKRRLAYPIKHFHHGYYVLVYFNAESSAVNTINTKIKLESEILRHNILLKVDTGTDREITLTQDASERNNDEINVHQRNHNTDRLFSSKSPEKKQTFKKTKPAAQEAKPKTPESKTKDTKTEKVSTEDTAKNKIEKITTKESEKKTKSQIPKDKSDSSQPAAKKEEKIDLEKLDEQLNKILGDEDLII